MSATVSITMLDRVILNASVYVPGGLTQTDIGILNGKIVALGQLGSEPSREKIDATGLTVLPGVIDSQVHFREPGLEHKEDLETGTRSAVLGGVTGVLEMPNTKPQTLTAEALANKCTLAQGRVWSNYAFFMGAAAENASHLGKLENVPGCCGVKIFMGSSTGGLLIDDEAVLQQILREGRRRVAVHCEDEARLRERVGVSKTAAENYNPAVLAHPVWRDEQTALLATQRLLRCAFEARRRVHVLHVTTAQEMELLARHKDFATVEVTPQHLWLSSPECYERLGTLAQMNPPIREQHHQDALWKAIETGVVDVIGSDHAPHTLEEKERGYPATPSGMTGVQTILPLMLDGVHQKRLSLGRLVDLLCEGPARLYSMVGKGRIALGYDADLTLVDLSARRTIERNWIASRSGWSPFEGHTVTGWPVMTMVGGHVVMREDEVLGSPQGQVIRFQETEYAGTPKTAVTV